MRRFAMIAAIGLVAAGCTSTADDDPTGSPSTPSVSTPATTTPLTTAPPTTSTPTSTAPSTPAAPTVPADVPTTGPNAKPSERPPVMPVAATRHTAAGARAFAKFFLQTIDWGYATTDSHYMRRYYTSSCRECAITRLLLDNARRRGNHYVGSRITIGKVGQALPGGPKKAEWSVTMTLTISAVETIDAAGKASNPDVAHIGFRQKVSAAWTSGHWTVVWMHGEQA